MKRLFRAHFSVQAKWILGKLTPNQTAAQNNLIASGYSEIKLLKHMDLEHAILKYEKYLIAVKQHKLTRSLAKSRLNYLQGLLIRLKQNHDYRFIEFLFRYALQNSFFNSFPESIPVLLQVLKAATSSRNVNLFIMVWTAMQKYKIKPDNLSQNQLKSLLIRLDDPSKEFVNFAIANSTRPFELLDCLLKKPGCAHMIPSLFFKLSSSCGPEWTQTIHRLCTWAIKAQNFNVAMVCYDHITNYQTAPSTLLFAKMATLYFSNNFLK
jgi:hypothetical protein